MIKFHHRMMLKPPKSAVLFHLKAENISRSSLSSMPHGSKNTTWLAKPIQAVYVILGSKTTWKYGKILEI